MISFQHLTVSVGDKAILHDISYSFQKNKIYAIMGPNGCGKSTLAYSLMGHPSYTLSPSSKIMYGKKDITDLTPDKRAQKGLFLSFQTPLALNGVRVQQLLQMALSGKTDPLTIRHRILAVAKELHISPDLLQRSLNDGASGGEKKKMEVLQSVILDRKCIIFDEVDTGVDVDALRDIAAFLEAKKKGKTYIVITHYNRILKYLKPDHVLIMVDGRIVDEGTAKLAETIEKKGYYGYKKE